MNEKPKYSLKAPGKDNKGNVTSRTFLLVLIIVGVVTLLCVMNVANLPYKGFVTLVIFGVAAFCVHKLLNRTVFDITYTLYEDRLVFMRKYGRLEWDGEVFPFDEAKFYPDRIEHRGRTYPFAPDDKLKEFLGI